MLLTRNIQLAVVAAVFGTLLLTYWITQPALTGPFVFDDYPNLQNLARIGGSFDPTRMADYLQAFTGNPGRPLSALSFLIDDYAWPSDPAAFKRTNLLLHLLAGLVVLGAVRSLARPVCGERSATIAAALTAAAWLLHPMQLSTSMLVVQRMTQLMTLASLAGIWWFSSYLQGAALTWQRSITLLSVAGMATLVAFLCKENGALVPVYLLACLATALASEIADAPRGPRNLLLAGLALPALAIVAYLIVSPLRYEPDGIRDFTPIERLMTQPRILIDYLFKIAAPRLTGTGLFHDDVVASRGLFDPVSTAAAIVVCLGLIISAIGLRTRFPLLSFAVLWFFGGHLLESTTLQLELYFEHRNYLPMVGPLAATAVGLARLQTRASAGLWIAAGSWLLFIALLTYAQAQVWGSQTLLAGVWAAENPASVRAIEFRMKDLSESGRYREAAQLLAASRSVTPKAERLGLHEVLLECYAGSLRAATVDRAIESHRTLGFNRSSLEATSILRTHAESARCGAGLPPEKWEALVAALLANPAYNRNDEVAAYLLAERASFRIRRGALVPGFRDLDASYRRSPSVDLSQQATVVLLTLGQCDAARHWHDRWKEALPGGFDGWALRMASSPAQTQLMANIQKCKSQAASRQDD